MDKNTVCKICFLSGSVFSALTMAYAWAAPIAAALGVAANMDMLRNTDIQKELDKAIKEAVKRTNDYYNNAFHEMIDVNLLKDLLKNEICVSNFSNLEEVIKETEEFRNRYYTNNDAVRLVKDFEYNFRICVCQSEKLSKFFVMSQNTETLENLKLINKLVHSSDEKVSQLIKMFEEEREDTKYIKDEVGKISKFTMDVKKAFSDLTNGLSYVLVSLAIYLVLGILLDAPGYSNILVIVFISYVAAEALMSYFEKRGYAYSTSLQYKGDIEGVELRKKRKVIFLIPLAVIVIVLKMFEIYEMKCYIFAVTGKYVGEFLKRISDKENI